MATTEQIMAQMGSLFQTKEKMREKFIGYGVDVSKSTPLSHYPTFIDTIAGSKNPPGGGDDSRVTVEAPDLSEFGASALTNKMALKEGLAACLYPDVSDFPEEPTFTVTDQASFMEWFNAVEGSDYEIVGLTAGVYNLGAAAFALNNSATKRVYGQNGAVITYSGADSALYYTSARTSDAYLIQNVSFKITSAAGRAIRNTHTVSHCEILQSTAADAVQNALSFSHCFIINNSSALPAVVTAPIDLSDITVYSKNNQRAFYNTGDLTRCFAMGYYTIAGIDTQSDAEQCYVQSVTGADNAAVYGIKAGNVFDSFVRLVKVNGTGYGVYASAVARGNIVMETVCRYAAAVAALHVTENAALHVSGDTSATGMKALAAGGSITGNAVYRIESAWHGAKGFIYGYLYEFTTGSALIKGNYLGSMTANVTPQGADGKIYGVHVAAVPADFDVDVSDNVIGDITAFGKAAAWCYGVYNNSAAADNHVTENNTIRAVISNGLYSCGIYSNSVVKDNLIGAVTTGGAAGYETPRAFGIYSDNASRGISGNVIHSVTGLSGASTVVYGVYSGGGAVIENNSIGGVAGTGETRGIYANGASCSVAANVIGNVSGAATYGIAAGASCVIENNSIGDVSGTGVTRGMEVTDTCNITANVIGDVTSFGAEAAGVFCTVNCVIADNTFAGVTVKASNASGACGVRSDTAYNVAYYGTVTGNSFGPILSAGAHENGAGYAFGVKGNNFSVIKENVFELIAAKGGAGSSGGAAEARGVQVQNRKSKVSGNSVIISAIGGVNASGVRAGSTVFGYQIISNTEIPEEPNDNNAVGIGHGNTVYPFYYMHYLTRSRIIDNWALANPASNTPYYGCTANAALNAGPAYSEAGGWNEEWDEYVNNVKA
jgi:hypothetical protein